MEIYFTLMSWKDLENLPLELCNNFVVKSYLENPQIDLDDH